MAISDYAIPFGLRDIKLIPYTDLTATELSATLVDLPVSRTLSFTEAEEFEDLRGDDQLITSHGAGPNVEWELEAGGISLEALVVINGGTLTTSGVSPDVVKRYRKRVTDQKPFFCLVGQSISDSGGDLHCIIYRAKVTDNVEGEFGDQEFFLTAASGKGFGSLRAGEVGVVYDFVHHETIASIVAPTPGVNEVQAVTVTGTPTGGTYTLTYSAQETANIPYNATASQVQAALEALSNIGVGDVVCSGGPHPGTAINVTFTGALGAQDITQMTADGTSLTGGSTPDVAVSTVTPGQAPS
jgi:hypothetical protein